MPTAQDLWLAYKLRWKRRRLLFRALRKRWQIRPLRDRTHKIHPKDILVASTMRNEIIRLPYFLDHYRKLGVNHFLIVDNGSDDGTADYLASQADVSVWRTKNSYKLSRFGVDWLTWLQIQHAHGHWCLTVDADEILVYPYCDTRPLPALTGWLDAADIRSFGALMLDMYPLGPLEAETYAAGQDPFETLCWFDSGNYMIRKQHTLQRLWVQGGVRARLFFADKPERAPTLSKIPLVKWDRSYAYVSSAHSLLPRALNRVYDEAGGEFASGVLLHSKFLHVVVDKSAEEKQRREHFENSSLYDTYYDSLIQSPTLWCDRSSRYISWRQLEAMGLMSKGTWL
jgi:glycosyltransferase involved in cell wall biosynthesis